MSKKITVTLSDKAEKYFNDVMYGLTDKDDKPASQSLAISESMETLGLFEATTDNQMRNWLDDFTKLNEEEKKFAGNPTHDNADGLKRAMSIIYWHNARGMKQEEFTNWMCSKT